jgi:hypothetical protein
MLNSRRASLYIKESFFFFPFLVCSPSQLRFFFSTSSIIAAAVGASAFPCPIFVEEKNSIFLLER